MTKERTHKTAAGQDIDMETLILKNENVRAVGNMNVNARGDVIDNTNKTTSTRSAQVNKNYRKQIGNVAKDLPVVTSKKAAQAVVEQTESKIAVDDIIVGLDDEPAEATPAGGLASAIAKAKEAKQEPQSTPRKKERSGKGSKKK